jgi:hypothetical protein
MQGFTVWSGFSAHHGATLSVSARGDVSQDDVERFYAGLEGWRNDPSVTSRQPGIRTVGLINDKKEKLMIMISLLEGQTSLQFFYSKPSGDHDDENQTSAETDDSIEMAPWSVTSPEEGNISVIGTFPPDWPNDIPIMEGLDVTGGMSDDFGRTLVTFLEGSVSVDDVENFYFNIKGWTRDPAGGHSTTERRLLVFYRDENERLTVDIYIESDKTNVNLILTKAATR